MTDEQIAANPFTTKYEYSEPQIKSLTENDTFETITEAGPLYVGNTTYEQPGLKKFQEMKSVLVEKIMKATDQLNVDSESFAKDLKALKEKYTDFLGLALEQNKKLGKAFKELTKDIIEPEVKYTTNFALIASIQPETATNSAVSALLKYQKAYLVLENTELLSQDTANTVNGLLTLATALNNDSSASMKTIGSSIETEVGPMVDTLGVSLAKLQKQQAEIATMFKQIDTAEYYMGMASVQYMEENLPDLETKIATLTPKDNLTAEDIEFIKELTTQYKDFASEIKSELENVDQKTLLAFEDKPETFVPLAFAENEGYAQKAFGALKSTYEAGKSVGQFTWSTAKSAFNGVKTVAGVTLDTLGAGTKSTADVIYGVANGNSASDITTEIGKNFKQVGQNLKDGKSGSEILKTAGGYFEGAENAGGKAAETLVEKTVGKGWSSWMAGHVGKLTVNMFTSLGKGITKVADTQATTGEILEGTLDIGLSFIGGSKVIVSGSQAMRGSKEAIKLMGQKGINFLGKVLNSGDLKTLRGISSEILSTTKLSGAQIEKLLSNSLNIEFKEGLQQEIIDIGKKLNEKFMTLIKEGGATLGENATTGAKAAYKEFVQDTFQNSLKGYKDALLGVLGKDFTAYVDNLVANKADDMIKSIIKNYVDKGIIPGILTEPELKDLAGSWDGGNIVIKDVEVSDEFRAKAEKEGCDISEIEKKKGEKQTMKMSLSPTSENGGNMIIKVADGEEQSIPFTYKDGIISGTFSQEGGTMAINLKATEENGSFKTEGSVVVDFGGGGLKMTADASASKPIPGDTNTAPAAAQNPTPTNNEIQSFANT
jgi:hypothetical protein